MEINKPLLILLFSMTCLLSCQNKFDGTSEKNFLKSRKEIEEKLTKDEKSTLEKAMRVITLSAMYQKFNDTTSKKESFDEISLHTINEKTYTEIVVIAEKFLKEDKERNVEKLQQEIAELENSKAKYLKLKAKLDVLEAKPVKIDLIKDQLVITCSFTNHSKEFINEYATVISYSSNKDKQDGWNCSSSRSNVDEFAPNETRLFTCEYEFESAKRNSKVILWDKVKFPITNFSAYNIVVNCRTDQLTLNGVHYELGRNEFDKEAETILQNRKNELKEYQKLKGTLEELELTGK
jgi:hypothetical protein